MFMNSNKIKLVLLAIFCSLTIWSARSEALVIINFPFNAFNPRGDVVLDATSARLRQESVQQLTNFMKEESYDTFPSAFNNHYGNTTALTEHLTNSIGHGSIGRAGTISLGLGFGASFTRVQALKGDIQNARISNIIPQVLPIVGIGVNAGYSFTERLDLRLSFFPLTQVHLPDTVTTPDYDISFRKTIIKTLLTYQMIQNDFGEFGLALTTFFSYTSGSILVHVGEDSQMENITVNDSVLNLNTQNTTVNSSWQYYSVGVELTGSYNLKFFYPYIGLGIGIEGGQFSSDLSLDATLTGDITYGDPRSADTQSINLSESGTLIATDSKAASAFPIRLIAGFEFNFYRVTIVTEAQYAVIHNILGASASAAFLF